MSGRLLQVAQGPASPTLLSHTYIYIYMPRSRLWEKKPRGLSVNVLRSGEKDRGMDKRFMMISDTVKGEAWSSDSSSIVPWLHVVPRMVRWY